MMNRRKWLVAAILAVPVVGGGLAFASTHTAKGYTCPVTGEELLCEKCCPMNREKAAAEAKPQESTVSVQEEYTCPITGEKLGCPKCCPLNKAEK